MSSECFTLDVSSVDVSLEGKPILANVSFTLGTHDRLALLGRNGSGKTTLLRTILGLVSPMHGKVRVKGEPLPHGSVGFVPQDVGASFLPWFRLRKNIQLPLLANGATTSECEAAMVDVQEQVDPSSTLDLNAYPQSLSGGQRQLAALMRCLVAKPKLVICDEPFSAMDGATRRRSQKMLSSLCDGCKGPGLLLVTHDPSDVMALAERAIVLEGRPATLQGKSLDCTGAGASERIREVLLEDEDRC